MSDIDVWVMALPNGVAKPWVDAVEEGKKESVIVDLSADYRFDPAWTYGLPELVDRSQIAKATRISNPGCYAVSLLTYQLPTEVELYIIDSTPNSQKSFELMVFRRLHK